MIKWLFKLVIGCFGCKWEEVKMVTLMDGDDPTGLPIGAKYIVRCNKCGDMKRFKF